MPENNTTTGTKEAEVVFEPVTLGSAVRNGQTVVIQTKEFKRQSKDKEGANFVGVGDVSFVDMIKFIGEKECEDKLRAWLDQKCQGLWREAALNTTGKKDSDVDDNELVWDNDKCLPAFVNSLQEWSAISETISDLRANRDTKVALLTTTLLGGAPNAMEVCNVIAQEIKKLELDIASKKRKTKAEREAEKAAAGSTPAPATI